MSTSNTNQGNLHRPNVNYQQGKYWCITIPSHEFVPYLPRGIEWIKGQLERGGQATEQNPGGYVHWQLVCCFRKKVRARAVKEVFGAKAHLELSRSDAANDYVWKDETCVSATTRFELGELPFKRNSKFDWDKVRVKAQEGRLDEIESQVYVQNYNSLKRIALDNLKPIPGERKVTVYWGPTGTGKSHRAWSEAGMDAYPKPPTTKWWDAYNPQGHKNVVIDEFDGQVGITHLLRWFDKYPCIVETKGGGCCLIAQRIWITSNIDPMEWYPDGNPAQVAALMRRLKVVKLDKKYVEPVNNNHGQQNAQFWEAAPPTPDIIPIASMDAVPEWRDLLGDLLSQTDGFGGDYDLDSFGPW